MLTRIPYERSANLIATSSTTQRIPSVELVVDPECIPVRVLRTGKALAQCSRLNACSSFQRNQMNRLSSRTDANEAIDTTTPRNKRRRQASPRHAGVLDCRLPNHGDCQGVYREVGGDGARGLSWPLRCTEGDSSEGTAQFGACPTRLK